MMEGEVLADGGGKEAGEVATEREVSNGPVFGDEYVVTARLGGSERGGYRHHSGCIEET